jgi:mannose-6-phosphate isomerase-like protein (cupin superfamily)
MDAGDLGSRNLVVTWVEVAPGGEQRPHVHAHFEQVYVVVHGRGRMTVAGDAAEVAAGDLVLIPPGAAHAIANPSQGPLVYVSATSPPDSMADLYDTQLQ